MSITLAPLRAPFTLRDVELVTWKLPVVELLLLSDTGPDNAVSLMVTEPFAVAVSEVALVLTSTLPIPPLIVRVVVLKDFPFE